MNKELWDKITAFDFDKPYTEYGFSIRLANENYWTKEFTALALLEYKKFMYLAATSEFMVSPSAIVDTVWHQHLIFTQSYQEFCTLLKKQIQHIPSTHNREDFEKFKEAKIKTNTLYSAIFGQQPTTIWECNDMFESLNLVKAKINIRTFTIFGILVCILLTVPAYFVLEPLYVKINNPDFIFGYIFLAVAAFIGLEIYNRLTLNTIAQAFDKKSFIFNLTPFELIYLKTQKTSNVIHGTVNELIANKTIHVNSDKSIELSAVQKITSDEQLQTVKSLQDINQTFYPTLSKLLLQKPIFGNISNCMDAFQKHCAKSQKFANLFYTNFSVLALLVMLGFLRATIGFSRDKAVTQIIFACIILTIIAVISLIRLTKLMGTKTIPELYRNQILTKQQIADNWQWTYFLLGASVLSTSFAPLASYTDSSFSSGSSCGSSCGGGGSSCGSSCGGCGGD
ncbi:glycine-rich domain-containing protein [Flavobacterium ardleyense]|uniref:Glycine-rich domain-containing protein n=1 Tax=Flavobacterium ardleyense TaxID=2038737 RepID=A0ABW5Z7J6_9FLAO